MKAKSRLSFIDKLFWWLNWGLGVAILFGALASIVDPRKAWVFAFFGLAYPYLLLSNLILIVYWLVRNTRYALLSVICILLGWNVLFNNVGFHLSGSHSYDPKLNVVRMMTYNVHDFKKYGSKIDASTTHEILDIITKEHPDIIGIQEFFSRYHGQYDMRDSLAKIMGTDYFYFEPVIYNTTESIGGAIFSKYPIIAHGNITFTEKNSENSCMYIDVQKGDRKFRVYNVHLQSIKFDPEDYKFVNRVSENDKPELASARRLGGKLRTAFKKRSDQVFKVKQHAANCPYPYIIIGDFNDTPASFAVNELSKGLKNTFREKGFGLGRTYNGDFPNFQIDYILATQQFDVLDYYIIEKKLSDHYPVRSDLLFK
jgi:endonuclease/exonuclease/phosphatase family metal-dependent hydrolase